MWKTRFEVSNHREDSFNHHRNLSGSSSMLQHYYFGPLPTVPRVRDDLPSIVVRPTPPSSLPNLEILTEEDEEIANCNNDEQSSLVSMTVRKQNSYQSLIKHQFVLPTIIESNDHEQTEDNINVFDDKSKICVPLKRHDSFVGTNTNYNQVTHVDFEKKERILNTNEMMGLTLDKRINELLQQKNARQNQSTSSSTDVNKTEICMATTFKDITAFFEKKGLATISTNLPEQKKILRAKRSLLSHRPISFADNDPTKLELIPSTADKNTSVFHHRIKRIKTIDQSQVDSKLLINNSFSKRCLILLIFLVPILISFYLTKIDQHSLRFNPFVYFQNSPTTDCPHSSKEQIHSMNENLISRYGNFVRHRFFSIFDALITFIGQLFFRVDKYEYQNNIACIVTLTYEHFYDWFIRNVFKYT